VGVLLTLGQLGILGYGVGRGFVPLSLAVSLITVGRRVEIVEIELGFIAAAPVVLEFAVTPAALKLSAAGILGGGIVEIP